MNTYVFGLAGDAWLLILLILIGFLAALFSYHTTVPPVSRGKRSLLIAIRTVALALLLFVLFEPILTAVRGKEQKPKISLFLDNSISAGATDNSGNRGEIYKSALNDSRLSAFPSEQVNTYLFDSEIIEFEQFSIDSVDFAGEMTDIAKAVRTARIDSEEDNSRAAVIFTDGRFNTGSNPIYEAMTFNRPLYIIGIGDTVQPKDIAIESLLLNEIAYIDNPIPINVNISVSGYDEGSHKIALYDNNELIDEQEFEFASNISNYSFLFEYNPKVEGVRKITARIQPLDDEITAQNNELSQYVRVLKNKRTIAIFAGSPSSDVAFFKQAVAGNPGIEIKEYIQKKGSDFYIQPNPSEFREAEMIIFINFPINSTPRNLLEQIASELERNKPFMFIAGYQTDYALLRMFEGYLPFNTVSTNLNEYLAVPDIEPKSVVSSLLRITGAVDDYTQWMKLPPIYRTETFVKVKPESEVISTIRINNTPLNEPLIVKRSLNNRKSIAVLGYGLYRWKMLGYAAEVFKGRLDTPDLYDIFVNNSLRWLSVSDKERTNSIRTTKNFYTNFERVEFIAQVYDASLTPIDNASVQVDIKGEDESREVILSSIGSGRYHAYVEGLSDGDYSFSGIIRLSGEVLGTDNGRFSVGGLGIEYQNLTQNIVLLQNLAEMTGGKYYYPNETSNLLEDIQNHSTFKSRTITERRDFTLWNLPFLVFLAISLFATEWFIRKRSGML